MKLNDAYKNWIDNPDEATYEELGKALLIYIRLETQRLFRTRCNRVEQEDLRGEAVIRVLSNIKNFNCGSTFATWVTRIIFNEGERMLGKLGATKAQGLVGNESYDPRPSLNEKIALKQLTSRLSQDEQDLVKLKMEGLDDEGVAEELCIPLGTAKSRWNSIKLRLRTLAGGV